MLEVLNPYTLDPIDEVALCDWDTIDEYLEEAYALHRSAKEQLPAYQRMAILEQLAHSLEQEQESLAILIAREGGKPLVDARVEVTRAIDSVSLAAKELLHLEGSQVPMDLTAAGTGRIAYTQREPIGPVVAISAFNHPLNLIAHQVAPAVAVGCPVVVKPASATPLSCLRFVEHLYQAGLPEAWCRCVCCTTEDSERMATDPRVAFVSFIGSAEVGWMLKSKLAAGTRCALEHGGVAPVIIDTTADVERLIAPLVKGGFYHAGQVCVSVQRVFAPRKKADEIAERLAQLADKWVVGDPTNAETDCGPLIRPTEVRRVESWVEEARKLGAKVLNGGEPLGDTTYAPTILLEPPTQAKVSQQEIFGPVMCVYAYDTLEEAVAQANALPYAFQASIFAQDIDRALYGVQRLDAATVMVNDHTAFRVDWMPFSGHRCSGYGSGGIRYTMEEMTREKLAVIKMAQTLSRSIVK